MATGGARGSAQFRRRTPRSARARVAGNIISGECMDRMLRHTRQRQRCHTRYMRDAWLRRGILKIFAWSTGCGRRMSYQKCTALASAAHYSISCGAWGTPHSRSSVIAFSQELDSEISTRSVPYAWRAWRLLDQSPQLFYVGTATDADADGASRTRPPPIAPHAHSDFFTSTLPILFLGRAHVITTAQLNMPRRRTSSYN